jgi:hypothetical protein
MQITNLKLAAVAAALACAIFLTGLASAPLQQKPLDQKPGAMPAALGGHVSD